ncbi:MAG: DUF1353 domain-containing protein [bacterium]|nr:DUF1353 domain-containing protein [bacterium]
MMIEWYSDNNIDIKFNQIPQIGIRYALPSDTKELKKSKKKYPFINKENLKVDLTDKIKNITYSFEIPKGYCYDGASIPRIFWRLIGSPTDNDFLIPTLIHDVLCENHNYINNDRKFSSTVFESLLKVSDVCVFNRLIMKNSVDIFQKLFCRWDKKG